jgi:hypothetical protein
MTQMKSMVTDLEERLVRTLTQNLTAAMKKMYVRASERLAESGSAQHQQFVHMERSVVNQIVARMPHLLEEFGAGLLADRAFYGPPSEGGSVEFREMYEHMQMGREEGDVLY